MDRLKLIDSYARYETLLDRLGFTLAQKQHQIIVRAPVTACYRANSPNARGEFEKFRNSKEQVTLGIDNERYLKKLTINSDERRVGNMILFSYGKHFSSIISHPDGCHVLQEFKPKPKGRYLVNEVCQTLFGDFCLSKSADINRPLSDNFLHEPWDLNWDYKKIFANPQFTLHEKMSDKQFDSWRADIDELVSYVDENQPRNGPMLNIDLQRKERDKNHPESRLRLYVDCCWPARKENRAFFPMDEVEEIFRKTG